MESQKNKVKVAIENTLIARANYNSNKRMTLDPNVSDNDYKELAKSLNKWKIATDNYSKLNKKD